MDCAQKAPRKQWVLTDLVCLENHVPVFYSSYVLNKKYPIHQKERKTEREKKKILQSY